VIKLVFKEVIEAIGGCIAGEPPPCSVSGVATDSRTISPGELFFAIPGPRFDGHDFVVDALAGGAVGAVVTVARRDEIVARLEPAQARSIVAVDDVVRALGRLGKYHRRQLSAEVIAVVGSNGKTTTKAMIDHVLSGTLQGRCSHKSYNNHIGVPLTLLSATAADDYLVVEVGTNAPGEIAELGELVAPDMVVVTCIGEEHLERLGDLGGVAQEELSILPHLEEGGFAAVNGDSEHTADLDLDGSFTAVRFGLDASADLCLTQVAYEDPWLMFTINGRFEYRLQTPGAHNALNATAAVAIARRLGQSPEEIADRLATFVPPPMRGEVLRLGRVTVINDAYNANPHSAMAAIEMLEALPCAGRRIAVFGEMRELGPESGALHRSVAERLRSAVSHVVLVGRAGEWMGATLQDGGSLFAPQVDWCDTVEECRARLRAIVRDDDVVLLKASRAVGLETVVEPLRDRVTADAIS
jgi:UDP-N-acetylmuramoyl-tripeptide--D-alanyl-D-alanine ligase